MCRFFVCSVQGVEPQGAHHRLGAGVQGQGEHRSVACRGVQGDLGISRRDRRPGQQGAVGAPQLQAADGAGAGAFAGQGDAGAGVQFQPGGAQYLAPRPVGVQAAVGVYGAGPGVPGGIGVVDGRFPVGQAGGLAGAAGALGGIGL